MSHGHTHAPGETHNHSHGPPQPAPQPSVDPALQALIDADFVPTQIALSADNSVALCVPHKLEKCADCGVDYVNLNRLSKILVGNPTLLCPPPPSVISQKLTQMVTQTKDEGNVLFKKGEHINAIKKYNMAASIAVQRPPWEANQFMREELSTVISNRSAAFLEARDYISALADAEMVISLRRNWPKGHFRKAKTLVAMDRLSEAQDALKLGLAFEPANAELLAHLAEIEAKQAENKSEKQPIAIAAT
ncbi:Translocation protein sec72 [Mycena sanguinolenta]|uniref:Translocation protein sec72 n=1 Tax=Mycena sanguinolenta TaxID=230812 RepID=A0A8H6Z4Y7_9AGAR|nr:Translocation protein sec72 [Mycena sanguinolenta]